MMRVLLVLLNSYKLLTSNYISIYDVLNLMIK